MLQYEAKCFESKQTDILTKALSGLKNGEGKQPVQDSPFKQKVRYFKSKTDKQKQVSDKENPANRQQ